MWGGTTPEIEGITDLQPIGSGGYSAVFVGIDQAFSRYVAVKVLHDLDDAGQRRFERERELMGRLDGHPNVITPYRFGHTADGSAYLVMEYAANGSLQDHLDRGHRFEWDGAMATLAPVGHALAAAHAQGILHRDIKPANILLTADWVPKLTDFGISSIREGTATASVTFTLAHTAPETFAGGVDRRDERSDLYSLASTLFAMVAGRAPFDADGPDSHPAYLQRIVDHPVPSLGRGPAIDRFLASALAKDPAKRPPTAQAFLAAAPTGVEAPGGADTLSVAPPDGRGWTPPPEPEPQTTAASGPGGGSGRWAALAIACGLGALALLAVLALPRLLGGDDSGGETGTAAVTTGDGDQTETDQPGSASIPESTGPTPTDGTTEPTSSPSTGPDPEPSSDVTSGEPAIDPEADRQTAERVVLQTADLDPIWEATTRRPREETLAGYEAVAACQTILPAIRGDGETATAGRDETYVAGNTAVTVTVTFYESEELAAQRGPLLVLDRDYQRCTRAVLERSVSDTNPTLTGLTSTSAALPAPDYGQRTEAVQFVTAFELEPLGPKTLFLDEWVVQIGRAVLVMTWVGETEFDPREAQLLQTVASRFERELATAGG